MILPLGDEPIEGARTPVLNYVLIAINVLVFVFLQGMGSDEAFTYAFATVPQEIVTGDDVAESHVIEDPISGESFDIPLQPTPGSVYLTLLTSMFMHGSWAHLLGNMLYLWIFGDNLEHALGRGRYLAFYLLTGVLASLAHVVSTIMLGNDPFIPSLGASGAISGVLGGYLVLFPKRRVRVLLFRFLTNVSALVAVGLWFLLQLVYSVGALGTGTGGGVAYAAHVGGFIAGFILVRLFAVGRDTDFPSNPRYRV